ncbi:MAG: tryptophan-rich sensory protein [Acidobacteria bacterium]|nr:tryptophan-rich sensory protein [Acidobacteriota bacterium]
MRWLTLALWIIACLAVGGLGGRWTAPEIAGWYRTLAKPSFNPPSWIFGPVWTTLYILMAIAAWLISRMPDSQLRTLALAFFVLQLALNLAWSWIFFHRHAIGSAALEVAVLWIAIAATTLIFSRVSSTAAWLMAPYWAWVTFASILNAAIWRLNQTAG